MQQLGQPVRGNLHPAFGPQPVAQARGTPGDPRRGGLIQQLAQCGPVLRAEKPGRTAGSRGIKQSCDPALLKAVDRGPDRDRVAFQQVGDLGRPRWPPPDRRS
ncbi:hypothetical protein GCM10010431_72660 [Streptomyces kunmingensis]